MLAMLPKAGLAQPTQVPAFSLERLQLDPFGVGSLVLGTGQLLPAGALRISAVGHYERKPLLVSVDGQQSAVVRDRLTTHFMVGLAVHRRLELGVELPFIARQMSDDLTAVRFTAPARHALGTPTATARVGLLQSASQDPFDLAAEAGIGIPIGDGEALAGSSRATFAPKLLLSKQIEPVLLSIEAGAQFRPRTRVATQQLGNQLGFGASLSTVGSLLRGELSWRSSISLTEAPAAHELLGGGRLALGGGLELFALGGRSIGTAVGSPQFRALMALAWEIGGARPSPALAEDVCQPGHPHLPSECPELDDDGDGIKNKDDKCPLEPEDYDGFQDEDGCPDPDNDGDGVLDVVDRCPNTPGPAENFGCPILDADHDGVADEVDRCPNTPGPASNQGCPIPEEQGVVITPEKLVIKDKVYFASGKAIPLARSFELLDQVAGVILNHPEIPSITVEGHTDNRGNAAVNRRLSYARANAVRSYLISAGVSASKLKAKGYGPVRPAATNATAEGREANRRIEFVIDKAMPSDSDLLVPLVPPSQRPPGKRER